MINRNNYRKKYANKDNGTLRVSRLHPYQEDGWYVGIAKKVSDHSYDTYRVVYEVYDSVGQQYPDASFWLPKLDDDEESYSECFWQIYGDGALDKDIIGKKVEVYIAAREGQNGYIYNNVTDIREFTE